MGGLSLKFFLSVLILMKTDHEVVMLFICPPHPLSIVLKRF